MNTVSPLQILIGYLKQDGIPAERLEAAYEAVMKLFDDYRIQPQVLLDEDGLQIILNYFFSEPKVGLDVVIDAQGKMLVELHDANASGRHAQFESITEAEDFIYEQLWSLSGSFGSPSIWRRRVDTRLLPLAEKTTPSPSFLKNVPSAPQEISVRISGNTILLETQPHRQVILSSR